MYSFCGIPVEKYCAHKAVSVPSTLSQVSRNRPLAHTHGPRAL